MIQAKSRVESANANTRRMYPVSYGIAFRETSNLELLRTA
jgi:hypothetical protein